MKVYSPSQILAERGPRAQAMGNLYHTHHLLPNQCSSLVVQTTDAPLPQVWSMVRCFDRPQSYKRFVRGCTLRRGKGGVGSVREVNIVSGLPAEISLERLDKLDDDLHVMRFTVIGGDHRLANYHSTLTLHEDEEDGVRKTVVMESYVVDVPGGNSAGETCYFANTIIGFNLKALAAVTETMALKANIPSGF
uniref:Pyrabaction resistance-like protein 5 n=1 Tax=Vitis yeshanensis TaxID=239761 RepID=A0A1L4AIQ8_9ROSI|nr:pyrabaction resistance-like protein 5 [Vitis yeshanensis]